MFKRGLLVAGTFIAMTVLVGSTPIFSLSRELPGNSVTIEGQMIAPQNQGLANKKDYKELTQLIPTEVMSFSGEDKNWTGTYKVIQEGQNRISSITLVQQFYDFDNIVNYTIEAGNKSISGTLEDNNRRIHRLQTDFVPEKEDTVTLILEWGNNKSVLNLDNKITDEVIPPEKAVEVFMDRFSTSDKEIVYIVFSNAFERKTWQLLTSIGTADINAVTGEFQYLYRERESD